VERVGNQACGTTGHNASQEILGNNKSALADQALTSDHRPCLVVALGQEKLDPPHEKLVFGASELQR
jgi:hypothetical protein